MCQIVKQEVVYDNASFKWTDGYFHQKKQKLDTEDKTWYKKDAANTNHSTKEHDNMNTNQNTNQNDAAAVSVKVALEDQILKATKGNAAAAPATPWYATKTAVALYAIAGTIAVGVAVNYFAGESNTMDGSVEGNLV
jgi:hypothetical protein